MSEAIIDAQVDLSLEEAETLSALLRAAVPANTRQAYNQDLQYLQRWCRAATGEVLPWPAPASLVLKFIAQHSPDGAMPDSVIYSLQLHGLAKRPAAVSTTLRRLSTWSSLHRLKSLANPMANGTVEAAVLALRRLHAVRPKSAHAITAAPLMKLLDTCAGEGLRDRRDRAIFLLAYATGGRRRSELCALNIEALTVISEKPISYRLDLKPTKRKRAHQMQPVALAGAAAEALQAWLLAAGIKSGAIFRRIVADQTVGAEPMVPVSIYRILERRLAQAGLPPKWASPHGFRSGFLTDAANTGVPERAAMAFAQMASASSVAPYYRGADLMQHPALQPALALPRAAPPAAE